MHMNIKKRVLSRGQITPFIILGAILLFIISAIFYINFISKGPRLDIKEEDATAPKLE